MLNIGDKAPSFSLESDSGKAVSLADFRGKSLVVYFYPKDNTPGCTREAIAFTELIGKIRSKGADVVGISKDSVGSHCSFRDKYGLRIRLLSDPDLSVHRAFGAYGEKTMYGKKVLGTIRSTFLIGSDGRISAVWPSVRVDGHAEAVLDAISRGPAEAGASKAAAKKLVAKKPAAKKPAAKKPVAKKRTAARRS